MSKRTREEAGAKPEERAPLLVWSPSRALYTAATSPQKKQERSLFEYALIEAAVEAVAATPSVFYLGVVGTQGIGKSGFINRVLRDPSFPRRPPPAPGSGDPGDPVGPLPSSMNATAVTKNFVVVQRTDDTQYTLAMDREVHCRSSSIVDVANALARLDGNTSDKMGRCIHFTGPFLHLPRDLVLVDMPGWTDKIPAEEYRVMFARLDGIVLVSPRSAKDDRDDISQLARIFPLLFGDGLDKSARMQPCVLNAFFIGADPPAAALAPYSLQGRAVTCVDRLNTSAETLLASLQKHRADEKARIYACVVAVDAAVKASVPVKVPSEDGITEKKTNYSTQLQKELCTRFRENMTFVEHWAAVQQHWRPDSPGVSLAAIVRGGLAPISTAYALFATAARLEFRATLEHMVKSLNADPALVGLADFWTPSILPLYDYTAAMENAADATGSGILLLRNLQTLLARQLETLVDSACEALRDIVDVTFYCSAKWKPQARALQAQCAHCMTAKPFHEMFVCARCQTTMYCNELCSIGHWSFEHRATCREKQMKK